jgi:WD40 repeat protein
MSTRHYKILLLIALPLLLTWKLFSIVSWRPRILNVTNQVEAYTPNSRGELVPTRQPVGRGYGSFGSNALAFSPDGKTLATGQNAFVFGRKSNGPWGTTTSRVHLWNVEKGQVKSTLPFFFKQWNNTTIFGPSPFQSVMFAPNGNLLMIHDQGQTVAVANLPQRRWLYVRNRQLPDYCRSIGFSPDSRHAYFAEWEKQKQSGLSDRSLADWLKMTFPLTLVTVDTTSGKVLKRAPLRLPGEWPSRFCLTRDGFTAVCATKWGDAGEDRGPEEGRLVIFDVRTGQIQRVFNSELKHPEDLACSPNLQWTAMGTMSGKVGDNMLRVQSTRTGKILRHTDYVDDMIHQVAFSPDNETLATASIQGWIQIWSIEPLTPIRTLGKSRVTDITFSPDGKTLASSSVEGTIKLWRTS